jgi:pleuromutilin/lincosamide/streptogramin A transport system ATP-binding/permease protein
MIVIKNLRAEVLGEPIFEKVNLVIHTGERIGILGTRGSDVTTFLRVIAGEEEMDAGTVSSEGERVLYVSSEMIQGAESLATLHHSRPTMLLLDVVETGPKGTEVIQQFIQSYRGGIVIASNDTNLMLAAKVTRVIEIHASTQAISSYTGSYTEYLVEREKNLARMNEAYDRQQKEKRRLEEWLAKKRLETMTDRSPEKGATIRTKAKYLQREILDKEIQKPD